MSPDRATIVSPFGMRTAVEVLARTARTVTVDLGDGMTATLPADTIEENAA